MENSQPNLAKVKITRYTKIQNERSQTLVFENAFDNDEEGLRDTILREHCMSHVQLKVQRGEAKK